MNSCRDKRGLALIAVLWIVIVMTAIVAVVSQTGRLNMKMSTAVTDEVRCKWACRAGTEIAIAVLNEDLKDSDCLSDLWSDDAEDFDDVKLERCTYSVCVTDEAGKLNVNTATKEQLMALPYMESQIADAILDWRDTDDNPAPEGAETGYYENLRYPYKIRNGPLRTIRELLRVKGVTEQQLYGNNTNLNGQLGYNERGDDEHLDQGWIAYLTCYSYENNVDAQGQSRVNINQANEQQLQSQLGIGSAQARWVVQNRGSGFKSIGDLINDNSPKDSGNSSNTNSSADSGNNSGNSGNSGNPSTSGNASNSGNSGNANGPAQPIDLQTFRQIADKITISGDSKILGKVNANTAPVEVLTALFGGDDSSRQLALSIVADRSGLPYGFQSVGELLSVQSMSMEKFKAVADRLTVRSNVFTIRCKATATMSGARVQTECVVDRSATPCTILYSYQGADY